MGKERNLTHRIRIFVRKFSSQSSQLHFQIETTYSNLSTSHNSRDRKIFAFRIFGNSCLIAYAYQIKKWYAYVIMRIRNPNKIFKQNP